MNPKIVVVPSLLLLSTALCLAQTPAKPATPPAQAPAAGTPTDSTKAGKTHTGKMARHAAAPAAHVVLAPDDMKWGPAPPSLPPGAEMTLLDGDPGKAGVPFTLRAKLPDGYTVPPHWHPTDERVTVLQGTLLVDQADKVNLDTAHAMPAGSFMRMPKHVHHYASAKGETIIQVNGMGPFAVTYVNPADDPRKMTMTKK
jgi:hypothetical protein